MPLEFYIKEKEASVSFKPLLILPLLKKPNQYLSNMVCVKQIAQRLAREEVLLPKSSYYCHH